MIRAANLFAICALALARCSSAPDAAPSTCAAIEPAVADQSTLQPELAFAARNPNTRALDIGTFERDVALEKTAETAATVTLAPGADLPGLEYRIRDPEAARAAAVCGPISGGAGGIPNDLIIAGPHEAPYGVLVRSGDNAVSAFDLTRGLEAGLPGVRLPDVEDACGVHAANPWFAAALGGDRVAVTAFGQARTYVLDMKTGAIEATLALDPSAPVVLDPPQQLPRAIDADCDGAREDQISAFAPRTPQAIVKAGDHLAVAYTNFYTANPPIYLPGVLAVWSLRALDQPPRVTLLPVSNPQELRALDDHRVLLAASGALGQNAALTPGAVLIIDLSTGAIEERYDLDTFAPGTAALAGGSLYVGSLITARVLKIDPATKQQTVLPLNDEPVDSIFRLLVLPGELLAIPTFNGDRLFIVDAASGAISPPPFYGPLAIGPGRPIFDGLSILARRPGRAGVDFVGPELFALSAIASRVTPIELRKVLGP